MPIIREYFTNVVEDKLRFVDGLFQLEGSNCRNARSLQPPNVHIQGCFRVAEKITLHDIRRHFNSNFNSTAPYMIFRGAEINPVVHNSFEGCMRDCRKSDTQIGGPWFFGMVSTYRGQDILQRHKLWLWQEQLVNLIIRSASKARHGIFDNKRVLFFVDELGGSGKSSVIKFLDYYGLAAVYNHLTLRDALHLIAKDKPRSCYVFDLSRSRYNDVAFEEIACTIESLTNGTVISTNYVPTKRLQHPSMAVIFSSTYPSPSQVQMVSRDRWQIIRLTQRHIPIDVRQRRERDRNREVQDVLLFEDECLYEPLSNSEGEKNEGIADLSTQLGEQIGNIAHDAHIDAHIFDAMYSAAVDEVLERKNAADVVVDNGQSRPDQTIQIVSCNMVSGRDDERGDVRIDPTYNLPAADRKLQQCEQHSQDGNKNGGPLIGGDDERICTYQNSCTSNRLEHANHDNLGNSLTRKKRDCVKAESNSLSSDAHVMKFAASVDTLLHSCYAQYGRGEDILCAMHEDGDTIITNQGGSTDSDMAVTVPVPDLTTYPTKQIVNIPTKQGKGSSNQQVHQSNTDRLYGDNVQVMDEDQPTSSVPIVLKVDHTVEKLKQQHVSDGTFCYDKHIDSGSTDMMPSNADCVQDQSRDNLVNCNDQRILVKSRNY